jgi:hypothetical protein
MNVEHQHWYDYWINTKNSPIYSTPPADVYGGTNHEPLASIGMSCFTDAIKSDFKENLSIIDYGCGAGILANFISERLTNFTYFGLEPKNGWGPKRISLGKQYFNDPRVNFGYVDEYNDIIKNNKIDTIILISVFTHLVIEDCLTILDTLKNIFDYNKDASIVFSCFTSETPKTSGLDIHINSNYYSDSYIKLNDLQNYVDKNNLKLKKHMDFIAMGNWKHEIFKITNK